MQFVAGFRDPIQGEIEALLERYNRSVRWLASQIGADHAQLGKWIKGENMPRNPEKLVQALEVLRVAGPKVAGKVAYAYDREIPLYTSISAGPPGSFEGGVGSERFPYRGKASTPVWSRVVAGDSMMPVFKTGDIAVFHGVIPEAGKVGHFFSEGDDLVKCLRRIKDVLWLYSFNEDFDPIQVDHTWRAKGECIGRIRYGAGGSRQVTEFPNGLTWSMHKEDF